MPNEIDHEFTEKIVCPYCGQKIESSFEYSREGYDEGQIICEGCESEFKWYANYEITYTTEQIAANGGEE